MSTYGNAPMNNGPAYAQPSGAPMTDASGLVVSNNQYMLERQSTSKRDTVIPLQGSSVCVWDATGSFFCEGLPPMNNGRYLKDVTSGSALVFEGFKASANAGNIRKNQEGFCDCGVEPYSLN